MNEAYMKKIFGLDGKTAVVTGSSSGIGQAIAGVIGKPWRPCKRCWEVAAGIEQTCARIRDNGGSCQGYAVDITKQEEQERFFQTFLAEHKHLDIFVANAGINVRGELPDVTEKEMGLLLGHGLYRHNLWTESGGGGDEKAA
ncbi:MAG: SDR family NAD(P)-dependent oxidoreductase [Dysosmobacter sp.]